MLANSKPAKNRAGTSGIALRATFLLAKVCEYAKQKHVGIAYTSFLKTNGVVVLRAVDGYLRLRTLSAIAIHLSTTVASCQPIVPGCGWFGNRHRAN